MSSCQDIFVLLCYNLDICTKRRWNIYKLYQRIRDLREDNDLKQSQLSEKLNITLKTYQRYERGETPITLEIAEQLATIYKVSLDYIAGKTNDKRGLTKSELSAEETDIIKKYRSLSEKRQGKIIGQIDLLAEEQAAEAAERRDII